MSKVALVSFYLKMYMQIFRSTQKFEHTPMFELKHIRVITVNRFI